ncbi:MAG: transcription termination factor Rho, partial [Acidobacteriota bacterium]
NRSGTRKEELLTESADLNKIWILRKVLSPLSIDEAMDLLLDKLKKFDANGDFLNSLNKA